MLNPTPTPPTARRLLIEELRLSSRAYNALVRAGVVYVDELYALRVSDLAAWKGIRGGVVAEIAKKIGDRTYSEEYGICVRTPKPHPLERMREENDRLQETCARQEKQLLIAVEALEAIKKNKRYCDDAEWHHDKTPFCVHTSDNALSRIRSLST